MAGLTIFNELSNSREPFKPLAGREARIFVCGPTVQDYMHVGHARTYIFYDLVSRHLAHLGYGVKMVINMTDIDEGIVRASESAGISVRKLTARYARSYRRDMEDIGVRGLYRFEPVSKYLGEMKRQISVLLKKGFAYRADGCVFFDTSKSRHFGELSHMSRQELALRPLELYPDKRNIIDFSLWRKVPYRTQLFDSPWGKGWPGWHIQDTAVAISELGRQYDIHGGAYELIYPHHEAEIAQAEALNGIRPYVRYWVHTGLVTISGRKMSKSEGNTTYVRDILKEYGPDPLRLYMLSTPYRADLDFDPDGLKAQADALRGMRERLDRADEGKASRSVARRLIGAFDGLLNDDFDVPRALDLCRRAVNRPDEAVHGGAAIEDVKSALRKLSSILGVNLVE